MLAFLISLLADFSIVLILKYSNGIPSPKTIIVAKSRFNSKIPALEWIEQ